MAARQIHHMNVVAHTGTIRGGIVITENREILTPAYSHLSKIGHEIAGFAARIFT